MMYLERRVRDAICARFVARGLRLVLRADFPGRTGGEGRRGNAEDSCESGWKSGVRVGMEKR